MSEHIISLKGVTKEFETKNGKVVALRDINLDIDRGDSYGIIGLSGAGKSTLVRTINLLEQPTEGKVLFDGNQLTGLSGKDLNLHRRKISMIFQQFNLLMQRDAIGNICFPMEIAGVHKQKAVASDPEVILCDEATSALDPKTTRSILKLLRKINEERGITLVVITHEMSVIKQLCNRVAVIENGEIVERGEVQDIFARPKTRAARKLFFPDDEDRETAEGRTATRNRLRLAFNEKTAYKPIISNMILATGEPVNLLYANMDALLDEQKGQMVICLSDNAEAAEKQKAYLIKEGVDFTEIPEDSDYYDYPLHGPQEEVTE